MFKLENIHLNKFQYKNFYGRKIEKN